MKYKSESRYIRVYCVFGEDIDKDSQEKYNQSRIVLNVNLNGYRQEIKRCTCLSRTQI